MYYGYSILSGKEKSNYIRGGEYMGLNMPPEKISSESGNFTVMRNHKERNRITEIDYMLYEVKEEYISLSRSVLTASDTVKSYLKSRIDELQTNFSTLQDERKRLLYETL